VKALRLNVFGDPVASIGLVDLPEPGGPAEGEALVELEYAPIHPSELLMVRGMYGMRPPLPFGLGQEGVGIVLAVGRGVRNIAVGDRVSMPIDRSAWRERVVLPAADLIAVPIDADPRQLSMLRSNPPTAALLLSQYVNLQPGEWVIQNAGNSGVGRCVSAFARERGLKVVSVVRRPELVSELLAAGADAVLVDQPQLNKAVAEATAGAKLRLGLDGVGGESTASLASCLAPEGMVVSYSGMSGKPAQISALNVIFRDLSLRGFWLGHPKWQDHALIGPAVALAARLVADGKLHTPIAGEFSLHEAELALAQAQRGGKVLFRIHPRA
jgi:NADPH:quinone reductase-like Zn-dependent oxidoreductase